jgi:hypothetical protein
MLKSPPAGRYMQDWPENGEERQSALVSIDELQTTNWLRVLQLPLTSCSL